MSVTARQFTIFLITRDYSYDVGMLLSVFQQAKAMSEETLLFSQMLHRFPIIMIMVFSQVGMAVQMAHSCHNLL